MEAAIGEVKVQCPFDTGGKASIIITEPFTKEHVEHVMGAAKGTSGFAIYGNQWT